MNNKDILIIKNLINELNCRINEGFGPFMAAVYDNDRNLISKAANSVLSDNLSLNHAEVNAIKLAEEKFKTYNLAPYNLSLYVTSEPCMMCLGAIMWAGIKKIFFSVPSSDVERITGFDEGFKPDWINEFKKRGIEVYPLIEKEAGIKVLERYVKSGGTIYKPSDKNLY